MNADRTAAREQPHDVRRPLLITWVAVVFFVKSVLLGLVYLMVWSLHRNGLIGESAGFVKASVIMLGCMLGFGLLSVGLLCMRRWARVVLVMLLVCVAGAKLAYLVFDYDVGVLIRQQLHPESQEEAQRSRRRMQDVMAMADAIGVPEKITGAMQWLYRLQGISVTADTQTSDQSADWWLWLLLGVDGFLLWYLYRRRPVVEGFRVIGGHRLDGMFRFESVFMTLLVLLCCAIVVERVYIMVLWKQFNVVDHLIRHPQTISEPVEFDAELVEAFARHSAFGYTIYLPPAVQLQEGGVDFIRTYMAPDRSFLCSISPLTALEYRYSRAALKARWNPVLLILVYTASFGDSRQTEFVHARQWEGWVTNHSSTSSGTALTYTMKFDDDRFASVTFMGESRFVTKGFLNRIVAAITPEAENAVVQ